MSIISWYYRSKWIQVKDRSLFIFASRKAELLLIHYESGVKKNSNRESGRVARTLLPAFANKCAWSILSWHKFCADCSWPALPSSMSPKHVVQQPDQRRLPRHPGLWWRGAAFVLSRLKSIVTVDSMNCWVPVLLD